MKTKIILIAFICLSPLIVWAQKSESIAAVVDKDIILSGEVSAQLRFLTMRQNIDPKSLSSEQLKKEWDKVLQMLIDDLLIDQEVRNRLSEEQKDQIDRKVEELTNKAMVELRDQYNSPEALQRLEQEQGISWEEIRRLRKRQIYKDYLRMMVIPHFIPQKITPPTPEEIEKYKEENPGVDAGGKALIAHILFYVPATAAEEEAKAIQRRAQEIALRARAGESFEELARQYSEHAQTKDRGGALPEFKKGDYYEEFNRIFDMKENEISDPIRTPIGYHVVKVLKLDSLEDLVLQEKGKRITLAWLQGLRSKAKIEIRD
ncbi:MAG: peptidylprolyl isomerase [Candidatus Omnitrophota bacterium]